MKLDPRQRASALARLADEEFDILVIGGGVVGAGTALDAVSRGLSVAVVEARDWAAGTSSKSSKLIHGGLRYLEQRDFRLVAEALRERALLSSRIAPHLVHPVQFVLPLRHWIWERPYIGAGVTLYDVLGRGIRERGAMPWHRQLSRRAVLRAAPALRRDAVTGGISYYDAQTDDARFTMTLARTAVGYGVAAVTRAPVTGFRYEGDRVAGVRITDTETGAAVSVRARQVISAVGVWTDKIRALAGTEAGTRVRAAKGVHLVVRRDAIDLTTALIARTEKSVLLIIPWGAWWLIGTTDTPWDGPPEQVRADDSDIDYLLEHVNSVLTRALDRADIVSVYAGLRPLVGSSEGSSDDTAKLSRDHVISAPVPGLITITGGKFTTYRVMAADAVDTAVRYLPERVPESATARLPLAGATGYEVLWNERYRLASEHALHVNRIEHLLNRYGANATEVLDLIGAGSGADLAEPVSGASGYLRAEVVYAASHEGALHLDDIIERRTRISIEEPDGGLAAVPEVARLAGQVLGWDEQRITEEVARYTADSQCVM
jgi:glycerol-3-phosphate dehydrogenase